MPSKRSARVASRSGVRSDRGQAFRSPTAHHRSRSESTPICLERVEQLGVEPRGAFRAVVPTVGSDSDAVDVLGAHTSGAHDRRVVDNPYAAVGRGELAIPVVELWGQRVQLFAGWS